MTTALQIINRAAELIGYKDPDEPLSGNDSSNFLGVLNSLVDSWNTQSLFIPTVTEEVASASAASVTIGPGQTIDVVRPIRLEDGCFVRLNGVDYPLQVVNRTFYNGIAVKTVTGSFPQWVYYDTGVPTGNIFLWPVPISPVELHLQLQSQLTEFSDLSTEYSLAQGYKRALEYSLAEELAPGRRPLDPQVARLAATARRAIKISNFDSPQMDQAECMTPYMRFLAGK